MISRRIGHMGILAVCIAACELNPADGGGELRTLNNAELTALFSDVIIKDWERSMLKEFFYADGTYQSQSRVRYRGRYVIAGNEICVTSEASASPFCRRFAEDKSGRILLVYSRSTAGERTGLPIPYIFAPIETESAK
jgi:hypothetical protein